MSLRRRVSIFLLDDCFFNECHLEAGRVIGVSHNALFDVQMINSNKFSTTEINERKKESERKRREREASRQLTQVDSSFVERRSLCLDETVGQISFFFSLLRTNEKKKKKQQNNIA